MLVAGNLCQLKRNIHTYDLVYSINRNTYTKLRKGVYLTVVKVLLSKRVAVKDIDGDLYTMSMSLLDNVVGTQPSWEV